MSKCKGINKNGKQCDKYASIGFPDGPKIACTTHRKPGMVTKKKYKKCQNCDKTAIFGFVGGEKICCGTHKLTGMEDMVHKKCEFKGCRRHATHGRKGSKKRRCGKHPLKNMDNLHKKNCIHPGCNITASYSKDGKNPKYCFTHKMSGMMPPLSIKCKFKDCIVIASYGTEKADYCKEHCPINSIYVKGAPCLECSKQPSFGYINEKALYCAEHKKENMFDLRSKLCEVEGCGLNASFGYEGGKPLYCLKHSDDSMCNVKSKKCNHIDCDIVPTFGFDEDGIMISCEKHKEDGMIGLAGKRCKFPSCKTRASFGLSDGEVEYCANHRNDNMIDLVSKKCEYPKCMICASFGYIFGKPLRCKAHKEEDMCSVKSIICNHPGCDITARFGIDDIERCFIHKDDNMSELSKSCCEVKNCDKRVRYGFPGNFPKRCAEHQKPGQIVQPRKRCIIEGCKEIAIYGLYHRLHCENHKEEDEYNLVEKECKSCNLLMILNEDELCGFCDPNMIKNVRLLKQKEIKTLLDNKNYEYSFYDNMVDSRCGLERPDFVFDCGSYFVVLEVDEEQHKRYNKQVVNMKNTKKDKIILTYDCEKARMANICYALGMKTIFIRYNPDNYKLNNIKQTTTKTKRHSILLKYLNEMLKQDPEKLDFLSVAYLFYDEFDVKNIKLEEIELQC